MSEEEIKTMVNNAFKRFSKELEENPDNVFNYLELQKKYNSVLKTKVKLQQGNKKYKEVINKAIALLEDDNICADIRRNKPIDDNRGLPFPKCIVEYGVEKELLSILKEVEDK